MFIEGVMMHGPTPVLHASPTTIVVFQYKCILLKLELLDWIYAFDMNCILCLLRVFRFAFHCSGQCGVKLFYSINLYRCSEILRNSSIIVTVGSKIDRIQAGGVEVKQY